MNKTLKKRVHLSTQHEEGKKGCQPLSVCLEKAVAPHTQVASTAPYSCIGGGGGDKTKTQYFLLYSYTITTINEIEFNLLIKTFNLLKWCAAVEQKIQI